jgi:hypothetical protein
MLPLRRAAGEDLPAAGSASTILATSNSYQSLYSVPKQRTSTCSKLFPATENAHVRELLQNLGTPGMKVTL